MNSEKPIIELLPPLHGRCRALVIVLRTAFSAVPLLLGVWSGAEFGWFYGLLVWIAAVFAGLILLSKLKLTYVPLNQHELSHSSTAILKWFVALRLCGYDRNSQAAKSPDISEAPR